MGVYINMEMPTLYRTYKVRFSESGDGKIVVGIANEDSTAYRPIGEVISVPPHGRLIDESAIELSKYEKAAHDALHNGKGSILYDSGVLAGARAITRLVRNAPTIIPAEEDE